MLQLGARFYRPEVRRFVQQDPMVEGGSLGIVLALRHFGLVDPDFADWTYPCDPFAGFSRGMGIGSGALLTTAAGLAIAEAAGASGANPWLGTVARHGAHHGRGPHWQGITRWPRAWSRGKGYKTWFRIP